MIVFVNVVKFAIAVIFVPILVALTTSFMEQLGVMKLLAAYFILGIWAYVVFHLFIYVPQTAYRFFQKIFSETLRFSTFLSNNLPFLVPLCPVLILLIHYILQQFVNPQELTRYFMIILGFTLAMHVILSAQDLYDEDTTAFKPHYCYMIVVIYVVNIIVIAVLLHLNFEKFSLAAFFQQTLDSVIGFYQGLGNNFIQFKK